MDGPLVSRCLHLVVRRGRKQMQIMDAIYKRRAMRLFQRTPVGEDLLRKLLDAAV
jgi:hypothetical protein